MFSWFRKKEEIRIDPLDELCEAIDEVNRLLREVRALQPLGRYTIWVDRDPFNAPLLTLSCWVNRCAIRIYPEE